MSDPTAARSPFAAEPLALPGVVLLGWRRDGGRLRLDLRIPADSRWFQGHFPSEPILPGVVQLKLAVEAARQLGPGHEEPRSVHQLKFKAAILPDAVVELRLEPGADGASVFFCFSSTVGEHSSGRLAYSPG